MKLDFPELYFMRWLARILSLVEEPELVEQPCQRDHELVVVLYKGHFVLLLQVNEAFFFMDLIVIFMFAALYVLLPVFNQSNREFVLYCRNYLF